jgi:hypothetical protein
MEILKKRGNKVPNPMKEAEIRRVSSHLVHQNHPKMISQQPQPNYLGETWAKKEFKINLQVISLMKSRKTNS